MKSTIKAVATLIFLLIFGGIQQTHGQENQNYFDFEEILTKLNSASNNEKSLGEINAQLIKDIQKRKVDFILTSEDKKSLKKAGGSKLLIKSLSENVFKKEQDLINQRQSLYKKFTDNYASKNPDQLKIAIEAGKEFVKRYTGEVDQLIIDYLVKTIPILEKSLSFKNCCFDPVNKDYEKFNNSLKNKNWEDLLEVSAEILIKQTEIVDIPLAVASLGFDETANKKDGKYLNQILLYAEKAIELLENDKKSVTENYGVLTYSYKTKDFPDGKANALGYMNYIVGYLNYFYLNQKDEAVSYFQKSLQYESKANELLRQLNLTY